VAGRLNLSPDALSRELAGEVLILDLRTSLYFGLKGTAARIWQMIEASHDRDSIVSALSREYGAPEDVIAADVDAFITDLLARGLIAHSEPAA
jgi:hypothetical protein